MRTFHECDKWEVLSAGSPSSAQHRGRDWLLAWCAARCSTSPDLKMATNGWFCDAMPPSPGQIVVLVEGFEPITAACTQGRHSYSQAAEEPAYILPFATSLAKDLRVFKKFEQIFLLFCRTSHLIAPLLHACFVSPAIYCSHGIPNHKQIWTNLTSLDYDYIQLL